MRVDWLSKLNHIKNINFFWLEKSEDLKLYQAKQKIILSEEFQKKIVKDSIFHILNPSYFCSSEKEIEEFKNNVDAYFKFCVQKITSFAYKFIEEVKKIKIKIIKNKKI